MPAATVYVLARALRTLEKRCRCNRGDDGHRNTLIFMRRRPQRRKAARICVQQPCSRKEKHSYGCNKIWKQLVHQLPTQLTVHIYVQNHSPRNNQPPMCQQDHGSCQATQLALLFPETPAACLVGTPLLLYARRNTFFFSQIKPSVQDKILHPSHQLIL